MCIFIVIIFTFEKCSKLEYWICFRGGLANPIDPSMRRPKVFCRCES